MSDICVSCLKPHSQTRERYEIVGNYCLKCLSKIETNIKTRQLKAAEMRELLDQEKDLLS